MQKKCLVPSMSQSIHPLPVTYIIFPPCLRVSHPLPVTYIISPPCLKSISSSPRDIYNIPSMYQSVSHPLPVTYIISPPYIKVSHPLPVTYITSPSCIKVGLIQCIFLTVNNLSVYIDNSSIKM